MTPEEAISYLRRYGYFIAHDSSKVEEALNMAISALQWQYFETRKNCSTCKHYPPSKKWHCVDCDMREPAERWEPKEVKNSKESSLTQNGFDTISRTAAIDALCSECHGQCIPCKYYPCSEIKAINELPSAQPDIIRCKDCKWYELPSYGITENCVRWMKKNGILLPIKPDDFCSRAERRTDEETD